MSRSLARCFLVAVVVCAVAGWDARGEFRLPSVISDHMVVQCGRPMTIWGWADAGEQVTVSLADRQASATAGPDGPWKVQLEPLEAGGPHELKVVGKNTVRVADVLVGEVWFCAGQSNMGMTVDACLDAEKEIAEAQHPQIRVFVTTLAGVPEPLDDAGGQWVVCSPQTAGGLPPVAYFFGRDVHKQLRRPVGLIVSAWGATRINPWISEQGFAASEEIRPVLERWRKATAEYPANKEQYDRELEQWRRASTQPGASASAEPTAPEAPAHPSSGQAPTGIFNGMVAPFTNLPVAGVVWYHGESNRWWGRSYRTPLRALIHDWRARWAAPELPFLIVQLPNYLGADAPSWHQGWIELRESQAMMLDLPKVGLAVTIDVGDPNDVHPRNKQPVGHRLALAALAIAYGRDVVYSGPIYQRMAVENGAVRLWFDHVDGGLVAQGGEPLRGFVIAGVDGQFVPARAVIDGQTLLVSAGEVAAPAAVRYAWANNPDANLYNAAGLPASPFRTDNPDR